MRTFAGNLVSVGMGQTISALEATPKIWDLAEVGYQEVESSRLLQQQLAEAGFTVEAVHFFMQFGVEDVPVTFDAVVDFTDWSQVEAFGHRVSAMDTD